MKPTQMFLIAVVIVAVAGIVRTQTPAPPAKRAVAPVARVAVCDVAAVLDNYDRRNELTGLLKKKYDASDAEDRSRTEEIRQNQQALSKLNPGSGGHTAQLNKIDQLRFAQEAWRKLQQAKFDREHRTLMEQLYAEVIKAIGVIARQKGYDAVFCTDNVDMASYATSELMSKMATRKCLYYNPAIDLSKDVTELLNRNYRQHQE